MGAHVGELPSGGRVPEGDPSFGGDAQKTSGRRSADRQSKDVLLRALYERNPELAERFQTAAQLVQAVSKRIGLANGEQHQLQQAAELHDIGKVAIPTSRAPWTRRSGRSCAATP